MPRYIAKLEGKYFEWSTVVEAPVTKAMSLEDFKEYYKDMYGQRGLENLETLMPLVDKTGISCRLGSTIEDYIELSILNGAYDSRDELIESLNLNT